MRTQSLHLLLSVRASSSLSATTVIVSVSLLYLVALSSVTPYMILTLASRAAFSVLVFVFWCNFSSLKIVRMELQEQSERTDIRPCVD